MPPIKPHRARKRFGQNFLTDQQVLADIISSLGLSPTDNVVEIGPGLGALTRHLCAELSHLTAIELDRDLVTHLNQQFSKDTLTLFSQDALTFDFSCLSKQTHDLRVVGNLPYNISSPLLFHLFDSITAIQDMHFMLQKEVAERLSASTGDNSYGRLSVMAQYYCDVDYLFTVPPTAFDPAPKVESAIVRLTPTIKPTTPCTDLKMLNNLVKEAFTYRRKTLSNSLKAFISPASLEGLDISPNKRAQMLSVDEFIRIANHVTETAV